MERQTAVEVGVGRKSQHHVLYEKPNLQIYHGNNFFYSFCLYFSMYSIEYFDVGKSYAGYYYCYSYCYYDSFYFTIDQ